MIPLSVGTVGILGVVPSDPEVIAVFPSLSSTSLPRDQEIRLRRGDSLDVCVQVQNDLDPPDPVQLDLAVLRFAAKQGYGDVPTSLLNVVRLGNEAAWILRRSYDKREIEVVNSASGKVIIHLTSPDTENLPSVPAVWDLELTVPKEIVSIPSGSTATVEDGSDLVAVDFPTDEVRRGDIFIAQGKAVLVLAVGAAWIRVDTSKWTDEVILSTSFPSAGSFQIYRGFTKTVAGGPFTVAGDVFR